MDMCSSHYHSLPGSSGIRLRDKVSLRCFVENFYAQSCQHVWYLDTVSPPFAAFVSFCRFRENSYQINVDQPCSFGTLVQRTPTILKKCVFCRIIKIVICQQSPGVRILGGGSEFGLTPSWGCTTRQILKTNLAVVPFGLLNCTTQAK